MSIETAKRAGLIIPHWYDDTGDRYRPVSSAYPLPISKITYAQSAIDSFGDLIIAPMSPVVQIGFTYGLNSQDGTVTTVTTGAGDSSAGRLRVQTGTSSTGSAKFRSVFSAVYRPGQGIVARFTPVFSAGVANSQQIIGVGTDTDGYFFGFNGATFGILHRKGGVDTWIPQSTWNGDRCDGTGASGFNWNKTLGNIVQIKYAYLGYANPTFWVKDPVTDYWILCHTIRYQNTSAAVILLNPDLMFCAEVTNSGNTSNLIAYTGSVGIFVAGEHTRGLNVKWSADANKAAVTTEVNLLTIRNCTTYNGVANHSLLRFNLISFSSTANNGIAILRMKKGAALGGAPSYTPVSGSSADNGVTITSGNSVSSFDVAGTTVTGGEYKCGVTVGSPGSQLADISSLNIVLGAGDTMTFSAFSTASTAVGLAVNWTEDI